MIGLELAAWVQQTPDAAAWLEQGRIARREGRFEDAVVALEAASRVRPDDADILLELGLAYYASDQLAQAERALDQAQALAPNYHDVTLARSRVALARGRPRQARDLAAPLAEAGDAEAAAIVRDASAARTAGLERLDIWTTHSSLDGLDDWSSLGVGVGGRIAPGWSGWGSVEQTRRFGQDDVYGEVGVEHRVSDGSAWVSLGGAPDADHRAEFSLATGGRIPLGDYGLAAVADVRFSRYPVGEIVIVRPGLTWEKADWMMEARWIHLNDETGADRDGWMMRGEVALGDSTRLDAALSDAPETSDGFTVDIRAYGVGVRQALTDTLSVRLGYVHEDRGLFPNRDEFNLSLTRRF